MKQKVDIKHDASQRNSAIAFYGRKSLPENRFGAASTNSIISKFSHEQILAHVSISVNNYCRHLMFEQNFDTRRNPVGSAIFFLSKRLTPRDANHSASSVAKMREIL